MLEKYEQELKMQERKLSILKLLMIKLLRNNQIGYGEKKLKKQEKLFATLSDAPKDQKFYKFYTQYRDKSKKNLEKIDIRVWGYDKLIKEAEELCEDLSLEMEREIKSLFNRTQKLSEVIITISNAYKSTVDKIQQIKANIDREKERQLNQERKKEEDNIPRKLTEEERKRQNEEAMKKRVSNNAQRILTGPRRRNLIDIISNEDAFYDDMKYLYGLATDILVIMASDQYVELKETKYNKEECRVFNANIQASKYSHASTIKAILDAYDVETIDELLEKYEQIRKRYYKKFSMFPSHKQAKYKIEKYNSNEIISSINEKNTRDNLVAALQNEKLDFPPSREKLVSLINSRIKNGKHYELAIPNEEQKENQPTEQSFIEYNKVQRYYINLTKRMSPEETAQLYHQVINDIYSRLSYSDHISEYIKIMQKLFCEIIFMKKGMKISDGIQYDKAISKIANEILGEDLLYPNKSSELVSNEEKEKREQAIRAEYIKYRVKTVEQGQKHMSWNEYIQTKYGLKNIKEPNNIEELVNEEVHRRKK